MLRNVRDACFLIVLAALFVTFFPMQLIVITVEKMWRVKRRLDERRTA